MYGQIRNREEQESKRYRETTNLRRVEMLISRRARLKFQKTEEIRNENSIENEKSNLNSFLKVRD